MKRRIKSDCPVCYALDVFGDKWTLLIVRDMLAFNKRSFREFLESSEGIATNILADRLKTLVEAGMAVKEADPLNGTHGIYRPTAKAEALSPLLHGLVDWGMAYGPAGLKRPWDADMPDPGGTRRKPRGRGVGRPSQPRLKAARGRS